MKNRDWFDDKMDEGGPFFWIVCVLGAVAFYLVLWIVLAMGSLI